jgi:WhiB family redox-sensing transcriptional regulator
LVRNLVKATVTCKTESGPSLLGEWGRFAMSKPRYVDPVTAAEWEERALCRDVEDQAVFFPPHGNRSAEAAKRICRRCPVADECLETALLNDERFGIWGGMTEKERRELKEESGSA